jgi:hypothetical protein
MDITVQQKQGRVPVTVLQTHGDLDASNYQALIAKAQQVYDAGARNILIDMNDTEFMGSSGLVALHSIALLLRGDELPNPESGWAAFHAYRDRDTVQKHINCTILNPADCSEMSGQGFFEVYTDPNRYAPF